MCDQSFFDWLTTFFKILLIFQFDFACLWIWYSIATLYLTPYLSNRVPKSSLQKCDPSSQMLALGFKILLQRYFSSKILLLSWHHWLGMLELPPILKHSQLLPICIGYCLMTQRPMKSIPHTSKSSTWRISRKGISFFLERFPLVWHLSPCFTKEWASL